MNNKTVVEPCRRSTMPSKSRCKFCYRRERLKDPTAKSIEIKKRCANPTNGCVVCNEYVCAVCWPLHVEEVRRKHFDPEGKKPQESSLDASRSGSVVMESIFATNGTNWNDFLQSTWEKKTRLFSYDADIMPSSSDTSHSSPGTPLVTSSLLSVRPKKLIPALHGGDGLWRETNMVVFPLREIIRQGWHILTSLMDAAKNIDSTSAEYVGTYCHERMTKISILQNSQQISRDDILKLYRGDLYASFLSGCSIAWENCDMLSPHIASLCQDLQGEQDRKNESERGGAFEQAYATAHLTPSQHSEICQQKTSERSILVFQLVGRKHWKVVSSTPEESSAKETSDTLKPTIIRSTEPALRETSSFDDYLYPGDILYIPRGMPYQSQTTQTTALAKSTENNKNMEDDEKWDSTMSFHIIVTLDKFDDSVTRKSTPTDDAMRSDSPTASSNIEQNTFVVAEPKDSISRTSLDRTTISRKRTLLIEERSQANRIIKGQKRKALLIAGSPVDALASAVGPNAALRVSYFTEIRLPTQAERDYVQKLSPKVGEAGDNEELDTGIRQEIRAISKVISARLCSLIVSKDNTLDAIYKRVIDLCELVKDSFEDKSEISLICDLTLLALIKREVAKGNIAIRYSV